jgi:hypothetical protein
MGERIKGRRNKKGDTTGRERNGKTQQEGDTKKRGMTRRGTMRRITDQEERHNEKGA